jgi:hypothetical protein
MAGARLAIEPEKWEALPRLPSRRKGKPVRKPPPLYALSCGAFVAALATLAIALAAAQ